MPPKYEWNVQAIVFGTMDNEFSRPVSVRNPRLVAGATGGNYTVVIHLDDNDLLT
jgi:hypothetical protein